MDVNLIKSIVKSMLVGDVPVSIELRENFAEILKDDWEIPYNFGFKDGVNSVTKKDADDMLSQALEDLKNRENYCEICKGYDPDSPNYGYTEYCKDCMWYPWADENTCPNKWVWKRLKPEYQFVQRNKE